MAKTNIVSKKVLHMYELMGRLARGEELYVQNTRLQEELFGDSGEASERKLRRYLEDIHTLYEPILVTEKKPKEFSDRKVTVYRVIDREKDVSKVFRYFLEYGDDSDLQCILQIVLEQNPKALKDLDRDDRRSIERAIKRDEDVFLFVSHPFEPIDTTFAKNVFNNLRTAVRNHEYRNIEYRYTKKEKLQDVKCLKLVFAENNWYLAAETDEGAFRWLRLAFVENVSYSKKSGYQKQVLDKYAAFFRRLEGPMTLKDAKPQKALLKASPKVARYFDEGMKPFFKSQRFVRKLEDGSIEFEIAFTQPLEILPFVKKWLPDIVVLSPDSLRKSLSEQLQEGLRLHGT